MPNSLQKRSCSRAAPMRLRSAPASVDEATRSVEFVAATENPVSVFDWESYTSVSEVLLMSGVRLPAQGRVVLLDTHNRGGQGNVLGSFDTMRVQGTELLGRATFSTVPDAEEAYIKVKEGHLTDVSVGYAVIAYTNVEDGKTTTIAGRSFTGPLRVVTDWELFELSLCPIGADPAATARAKHKEGTMPNIINGKGKPGKRADTICEFLIDGTCTLEGGPLCQYLTENGCSKSVASAAEEGEEGTENTDTTPPNAVPEATTTDDAERAKGTAASAVTAERQRINQIRNMCKVHAMPAQFESKMIDGGFSVDNVRASVLEHLEVRRAGGANFNAVSVGTTEKEKVRSAAGQGLLLRCGLAPEKIVENGKLAGGAQEFRSMTMREVAREFLQRAGLDCTGDVKSIMGRALTTTDLPALLADTADRMLLDGWENANRSWETWCGEGNVNDFRPNKAVGFDIEQTLEKVEEHGEYTYGYGAESAETYQVETYGKIFPITRQALINDDLGAFTRIAVAHGEAAMNTINKLAISVLTSNAKMQDGVPLFDTASHKNRFVKNGGAPTVANIGTVVTGMKKQVDAAGNLIQVRPVFFIAPVSIETAAEVFFNSALIGTQAQPNLMNIYGGQVFTRVYDALLDEASGTDWYMAGPKGKGVNIYFLSGQRTPRLEEKQGWSVDGVEFKVSIDVGAKAVTWQNLAQSTTATS